LDFLPLNKLLNLILKIYFSDRYPIKKETHMKYQFCHRKEENPF
jgi:hypothetical protein